MSQKARQAADLLIAVRANPANKIASLPEALRPTDRAEAYAIQRLVSATFSGIGGWKVGAANPTAEPQCGALPEVNVVASPASFDSTHHSNFIEAEVSFTIGHDLPPRALPYTREEVIAAMATAHPTIELVDSRFIDGDAVDAFSGLADTQSHFALIVGPANAGLGETISLRAAEGLRWVLPEAQGAFRRQVDALFLAAGVQVPRDVIRCDSLLTTKAIVRTSDRVTILPVTVPAAELAVGALRAIRLAEAMFERQVGVRWLAGARASALAEKLLAALDIG